jgi:DNA helicase-2/ATP-dependent DNA helicase PcrA
MYYIIDKKGDKMFEYSKYQNNLFTEVEKQTGHLMVNAVAGSGKTFSLLESMKRVKGNSIFLSFNKSIQEELASRVPSHVTTMTLHSAGLKTIIKNQGFTKVNLKKLDFIMQKYPATSFMDGMTNSDKRDVFIKRDMIKSLISIWKATLIDYKNDEEVVKSALYYNVNYDPAVLGIARSIMDKSVYQSKIVDFDDMIYIPVATGMEFVTYDNVFVDECQDLNRSQIEMVLHIVKKPNGRIISVGDPSQSIYGFRGADTDAMPRIKEVLNAKELPLSVCYRCPTSHIELAKEFVPHIEAAPDAPEGTIKYISPDNFKDEVLNEKEPMVLCRTNAPLIKEAIKIIKSGKPAHVRGTDIGDYLKSIVINFKAQTLSEYNDRVDEWEQAQLEAAHKSRASKSVQENIIDYADVLREFSLHASSPYGITNMIKDIFSNDKTGTIFSTVHKAKGLEADVVFIIRPDQLPLVRKDQQPWEYQQELNLKYVALTRSKDKLIFVGE